MDKKLIFLMKKLTLITLLILWVGQTEAQSGSLYGIVSKNYYSQVPDPFNPGQTYEQFDSATIRLGSLDLSTGFVTNQGSNTYKQLINLTGAALDPYNNTYVFLGASQLSTIDVSTGNIVNQVPLSNPLGESYFDNFRFNQSDSTLYGLARRYIPDPNGPFGTGEIFLSKANTSTGVITQLSTTSVGQGFALAGSAIDPYEMVYYFSSGSTLVGLDLYDGSVYSEVPFGLPPGVMFNNFTYSCADTALYGLVHQYYYSSVADPSFPGDSIQVIDSSTVKLGKIDPNTGAVSILSPYSVAPQAGFSANTGSAIDPATLTYYYSNGSHLVGISLVTGLQTSYLPFSFAMGDYFNLMRNTENCYSAQARRKKGSTPVSPDLDFAVSVYPNPGRDLLQVSSSQAIRSVEITTADGKSLLTSGVDALAQGIDISDLAPGMYVVKVVFQNGQPLVRKWIKS
ncbi:MAG: T9SS C-terminal target domain-containing protein [Bacteroidetes bacterium]|nr:MAG: T9SS C-terminal target domain-containing protein [Bacteroidota bacterium]